MGRRIEDVVRPLVPGVLAALVRRSGTFDECEDAVQEALLAATVQWPAAGVPDDPHAWLLTVASRRLTDALRSRGARRRREEIVHSAAQPLGGDGDPATLRHDVDDSLQLLFLCCHPDLTTASQVSLTLRAVGGLTTAEIAAAFLVPEATMAQRISRAKQRIREAGAELAMPAPPDLPARVEVVLHVLYLVFNEGYTASSGGELARDDLAAEAVRLTRRLVAALPEEPEAAGLLALMLLTQARRAARVGPDGALIPLPEQDRTCWDRALVDEGVDLVAATLPVGRVGPYQLQAAIAAVHVEAPSVEATDWPQILGLYELLERVAPNPVVTLNRAVAVAMVHGPAAGLTLLDAVSADRRLAAHHRVAAVRAHLLELDGALDAAADQYRLAARLTTSRPEQRYLDARARRLSRPAAPGLDRVAPRGGSASATLR